MIGAILLGYARSPHKWAATEPGFVYIFVSNEDPTYVDVYFDDVTVTHTLSPIVSSADYYPFGLTFNSYQRENTVPNMYQYNGKEMQDELGIEWLDYGARMYMPDIRRWGAIDPLAELMEGESPYNHAFDNPLTFIDRDGMKPETSNGDEHHEWMEEAEERWRKRQTGQNGFGPSEVQPSSRERASEGEGSTTQKNDARAQDKPKRKHKVKAGETLSQIAKKNYITVAQLKRANRLTNNLIRPGQELIIPGQRQSPSQIVDETLNTFVQYRYRGEGQPSKIPLKATPYGKFLRNEWDSHYRRRQDAHFLYVIPGNTEIMLHIGVDE